MHMCVNTQPLTTANCPIMASVIRATPASVVRATPASVPVRVCACMRALMCVCACLLPVCFCVFVAYAYPGYCC